jgi:uracil-DNA glycosylase family 4
MGFFFNEAKAEAKAKPVKKPSLRDIPVESLRKLSCEVCPRAADEGTKSPKMRPSGPMGAPIYLLGTAPSTEDDEEDSHWMDKAGGAIYELFGRDFMKRHVRSNYIQQCKGDQNNITIECCRNRIIADIEQCKPEVVVCIGDAPLRWALDTSDGNVNAMVARGTLYVARIGRHACYVYSILYPNYVFKKGYRKSEFELAIEHDIARIKEQSGSLFAPRVYEAPYDEGIEIITGEEPGDFQRLERALEEIARERYSAIDLETTGLRPYMSRDSRILTAAVGTFERTVAFPLDFPEAWGTQHRRDAVMRVFRDYLLSSGRKAAHGLSFEMEWLGWQYGEKILRRTEWDDTMMMAHTFDERPGTKSLNNQTRIHFGFELKNQSRVDVGRPQWWLQYDLRSILRYNGMDTKWTDPLRRIYAARLEGERLMTAEYERKVRLAPTLVQTQAAGLKVDFAFMQQQLNELEGSLRQIERKLKALPEIAKYEQRFGSFSPTNPDHVLKLYRDVVPREEVRVEERDGSIRWTTEEEALQKISLPSAKLVLDHRAASKLISTYALPVLREEIVCPDGLIRARYEQTEARTGRLACEDPNMQNWPKRKYKQIRGAIIPQRDWLAPCDYGQIEFRVVGMASEDATLVKYCWTGYDVHGFWAQRFVELYPKIKDYITEEFEVDWDELGLKTLRQEAKNGWVFPMFFGSSPRSCAQNLHIPEEIADKASREFWDEFQGVKAWQEGVVRKYEKNLYVETLGGRQRRGALSLQQIINHPIQGTALDIVTAGMNALSERADAEDDPELQPHLNVHDDLTFDLWDSSLEEKLKIIGHEMCKPRFDYINVPLIVEVSLGKRWDAIKEVAKFSSAKLFNLSNPYERA